MNSNKQNSQIHQCKSRKKTIWCGSIVCQIKNMSFTIKPFRCFDWLFKTMNKIDYKIDWQAFSICMVNELPLTQVCLSLLLLNQVFKASYWTGILDKHMYEFDMTYSKFRCRSPTPLDPFRSRNNIGQVKDSLDVTVFNYSVYVAIVSTINLF